MKTLHIRPGVVARNVVCVNNGMDLGWWVMSRRGCDRRTANRIANTNRWRYGSWRPSYRAVLLVDGREDDPPYAPDVEAA